MEGRWDGVWERWGRKSKEGEKRKKLRKGEIVGISLKHNSLIGLQVLLSEFDMLQFI